MRSALLAAVLVAAPALRATAQEVGVSQDEVLIGSCSDLTGGDKRRSIDMLEGAKAYFGSVNAAGGVYGRRLKVASFDDAGDVKQAVTCFKRLQDQGVFAGAFFLGSPPASRYAPLAEYNRIPALGFLSGSVFLYEPLKHYVFPVHPSYREMVQEPVDRAWTDGARKVAVVHLEDAFGKGVLDAARLALLKHRADPIETIALSKSREYRPSIAALKTAGAELVILAASGAESADFIRQSRESGFAARFVCVSNDPALLDGAGKELDGTIILQPLPQPSREDLPTIALYRKLLKAKDKKAVATASGLEGFVDAIVLVEGLKRAGRNLTRDKFADALESVQNLDLGLGPRYRLGYGPDSHMGLAAITPTVVSGGKEVPLDWEAFKKVQ